MSKPERMTYDEWQAEVVRRDCAGYAHRPYVSIRTMSDPLGHYRCECGHVRWVPAADPKEDE